MKAAVYYGPGDMRWEEVESPKCGTDDVIVEVKACGLCGTDVKTYKRGHPMFKPPIILGHEFSGEVVEAGQNVDGFSAGDRVVVAPYVPCGSCAMCRLGEFELCERKVKIDGAFTRYVKVGREVVEKGMFKIPESMDFAEATLVEPLACCLNALDDCNLHAGDTVLIVGAGPMGLINFEAVKNSGAAKILVAETHSWRRSRAVEMGAIGLNPLVEDIPARVMEITGGIGVDVVIIAVGLSEVAEKYIPLARKGGRVNLFGGFPAGSSITVDPNLLHYKQVVLTGSFGFTPHYIEKALYMISEGRIDPSSIITHRMQMNRIEEAIDLVTRQEALKVILYP